MEKRKKEEENIDKKCTTKSVVDIAIGVVGEYKERDKSKEKEKK